MALPFKEKLTELHHLGRAVSEYGEQQLLVLLMPGGLAANGLRFNNREEILREQWRCDTLRVNFVVEAPKSVSQGLVLRSLGFQ